MTEVKNVIEFKRRERLSAYYGRCPRCLKCADRWMNVYKDHWLTCSDCMTKWTIGSNLFSSWREENERKWRENLYRLAGYQEVTPVSLPDDLDDAGNTSLDDGEPPF